MALKINGQMNKIEATFVFFFIGILSLHQLTKTTLSSGAGFYIKLSNLQSGNIQLSRPDVEPSLFPLEDLCGGLRS